VKKNVLQFIGSFHQGGSERQALQLTKLLKTDGNYNVFLAVLNDEGALRDEANALGFEEIPAFPLSSFYDLNFLKQLQKAVRFLRENKIDVVHTHDFYTNVFGILAARLAGVKVKIASKRETGGLRSRAQNAIEKGVFGFADAILANSKAVKNYLAENGISAERIEVVYNGLDLQRLAPWTKNRFEICEELELPADENIKFITLVANMRHATKNQAMFLRAAQKVAEKIPRAHFVLAGEGELKSRFENLAKELEIAEKTHFIGACAKIPELLSVSFAGVLSSRHEGFSNSILEYMSASLPVVATNVGGASEAIFEGENGFLIVSDDAETLADRLIALLENDEKAATFGERGRKLVEEKFSCEAQLKNASELYERRLEFTLQRASGERETLKRELQTKINVALVAPSLQNLGGQSIQAARLLDAFADDDKVRLEFVPNDPATPFRNIKFLRTIFASIKFWGSLLAKIPKTNVVHIFSSGTTSYIISTLPPLFVAKLFGKKTILHYHTGEAETHLADWKLTAKPTMKWFDQIVVPSQFLVDVFAKFDLKATAIFNFVEAEKFIFRERKPLRPVFLSNRNFEAHYNVGDVLRAFRIIQNRFPEARLVIAGGGAEEVKLKDLAAKLKLENIEFPGRIANGGMPEIYAKADVYLNSSVVDNMPLSIIEAFSCGLPVVSYATGGIPFICENGETALLVEPKDAEALAREAVRLLENEELANKIIARARAECAKYSPENVCARWREIYRDVLSSRFSVSLQKAASND
jgi:L-malate glycosyltransferase